MKIIRLHNLSIKNKLVLMQVFTAVIVLGLCVSALAVLSIKGYKDRKSMSALAIAKVISANSVSSLEFLDARAASNVLSDLKAEPDIVNAAILTKDGNIFASYTKPGWDPSFHFSDLSQEKESSLFTKEYLFVHNQIQKNNETLGWVAIRFELSGLRKIERDILSLAAILLLIGTGFAFLIAVLVQRYISNPLLNLVSVMQTVESTNDYKVRSTAVREDEIGALSQGFNAMLATIEKRDNELAQSQQELDRQNALLNSVIQNMSDGLTVADKEGNVILWNEMGNKIIGASIPIENWAERCGLFHPDAQTLYRTHDLPLVKALNGEASDIGVMYVKNSKLPEGIYVAASARPLRDKTGSITGGVIVFHDITSQREAELIIRNREQQLATIYDTVGDSIFVLNVEENERYRFTSVNKSFSKVTGLLHEQIVGKTVNEIIPPTSLDKVLKKYKEAIQENKTVMWEETSAYPTGTVIGEVRITPVFDEKEVCTQLIGTVHDITTQKKTESEIKTLNEDLEKKVTERTARLEEVNEKLIKSEEKYREIVEEVADVVYTADAKGFFTYVNPAGLKLTGYTPNEIVGKHMSELIVPKWKNRVMAFYKDQIKKKVDESIFSFPIFTKSGEQKWVEQTAYQVREGNEVIGERCIVRDITKRKEAEEQLKESEAHFRALAENAPVLIMRIDKQARIQYINWTVSSFKPTDVIGQPVYNFIHPDAKEKYEKNLASVFNNGEVVRFEVQGLRSSQEMGWYFSTIAPIRGISGIDSAIIITNDITELKKAEIELKQSNVFIDRILENIPNMIFVKDGKDLRYLRLNKACEELLGYSKNMLLGKNDYDLFPKEQADASVEKDRQILLHSEIVDIPEEPVQTQSKGKRWLHTKKIAIQNNGSPPYLLAISEDITERKAAADQLKQKSEELEKTILQLNASVKEMESFSYSVSHDLRSPIRGINGFTSLLKKRYYETLDPEGKKMLDMVVSEAVRMGHLIDDLLAFSRLGRKEIQKTLVDLSAVAGNARDEVLKLADVKYKAKITIGDLPPADCDSALLQQVFINLIANALKFSTPKPEPVIEIGSYQENNGTVYYVKDNGVGFDMKYYNKLFGVFQRLHSTEEFPGTGIGLSIVQKIIERHGGRVWAEGKEQEGATFYFTLPKASPPANKPNNESTITVKQEP